MSNRLDHGYRRIAAINRSEYLAAKPDIKLERLRPLEEKAAELKKLIKKLEG